MHVDLATIFGSARPHDAIRLLGPAPRTVVRGLDSLSHGTFERVVAHSEPGCCRRHDAMRHDKKLRNP